MDAIDLFGQNYRVLRFNVNQDFLVITLGIMVLKLILKLTPMLKADVLTILKADIFC